MSELAAPHPRRKLALLIALAADALQILFFPFFFPGLPSPWDDGLDLVVAIVMIRLVGWHIAFLPTFLAEVIPGVGLLPTWTAAVWFVTRKKKVAATTTPPAQLP